MATNTQHTRDAILVTGGTGKTGRRVVHRLTRRGLPVRVGSRFGEPPFSWQDPETWEPAVRGMSAVSISFYPDLAFPGAAETVGAFARLAVRHGVRRLVLLSGRGEEGAQASERAVQNAGAEWTIVRANWFNQNFSEGFLLDLVLRGELMLPAGDAVEPFVDAEDIADVMVAALIEDGHAGRVYELSGPRLLTFHDVAAEISTATGRTMRYVPVTTKRYVTILEENGLPVEFAELFTLILDGRNASVTDGVRQALGREPRDFSDYVREAAASGVWAGR